MQLLLGGLERVAVAFDGTEEAGIVTLVTSRAVLLDLDEQDDALDYRVMLPISKIELFANNLYLPWAVASIGAPRVKIPKFHGYIKNYVPQSAQWSPTSPNAAAQPLI